MPNPTSNIIMEITAVQSGIQSPIPSSAATKSDKRIELWKLEGWGSPDRPTFLEVLTKTESSAQLWSKGVLDKSLNNRQSPGVRDGDKWFICNVMVPNKLSEAENKSHQWLDMQRHSFPGPLPSPAFPKHMHTRSRKFTQHQHTRVDTHALHE